MIPALCIKDLSKVYDNGFEAVTDLSLDIADGEFLVLVGPSGCGKSTALRMIAGLETISSGEMRIGDRVVNDVQPKDRDIAMVFQNYALYPHMTVFDNIGFALKLAKVPRDEIKKRVDNAARILELTENLDKKPGQLSGGQRQRVAMGRAIVRDPAAFLMDEPLSNLDAKLRVQMRAEIAALQRELGVTTFYVTHDQVEAMTMGDRVAVIKRGILQQAAAPQELYDHPENLFVAGFIGSPAMNLYQSTIRRNGSTTIELGSQTLEIDPQLLAERPAIESYVDKPVAVGIRPEDMEDVAVVSHAPEERRLRSEAHLIEALGSDVLVHFNIDAERVVTQETIEAADGAGEEVADLAAGDGTHTVARFNPRSSVRIGDTFEIAVDTHRLHFFDLDTGLAIRD